MARYIDVEPLEDKLKEHIRKTESELMLGALSTFLRVLDITPTADVAPVRHGHWIKISPAGIYECSECGKDVMTSDIEAYEHCHGCGARMDAKE